MRTSIFAVALVALFPALATAESLWQTDYTAAQEQAASLQKPLLVVFGPGKDGGSQLIGGGDLPQKANQVLADSYVCCFVDTSTPEGKALARKFDIILPTGLVISDKTGNHMAFWHQGTLAAGVLEGYLARFADPTRPVVTTETNRPASSVSYYPPAQPGTGNIQPGGTVCRT